MIFVSYNGNPNTSKTKRIIITETSSLRTRRGNGPSLVRVVTFPSLDPWERTSVRFESTCNIFFSRKYISKCRLQHVGLVQVAMWRKAKTTDPMLCRQIFEKLNQNTIKHWDRDKIDANLQIAFSIFFPMKIVFWFSQICLYITLKIPPLSLFEFHSWSMTYW